MSSAQWQQNMEKVHEFAGEMGRDMSSFQGIHSLSICIDKDREKAPKPSPRHRGRWRPGALR